jgi:hypothetical protein
LRGRDRERGADLTPAGGKTARVLPAVAAWRGASSASQAKSGIDAL